MHNRFIDFIRIQYWYYILELGFAWLISEFGYMPSFTFPEGDYNESFFSQEIKNELNKVGLSSLKVVYFKPDWCVNYLSVWLRFMIWNDKISLADAKNA